MGGKSSDETSSTQMVMPWPGAAPHLTGIYDQAKALNEAGQPAYYPGQTFAPRDPLQNQAMNMSLNYAMNSMPGQIYDTQRAHSFALNSPDVANNPYVQNMNISNANLLNRNLSENILPQIGRESVMTGGYGGSRQGVAEGIAARGTQEAIANSAANTNFQAYNRGLGAQGLALGMSPQVMGMGMAPMDVMSQVGAYNRGLDQEALDADMARWQYNQNLPWENLNRYNSIVGMAPWGSQTTAEGGGSSPLGGAISGGMLGYGLAGMGGGAAGAAGAGSLASTLGFSSAWPLAAMGAVLGGII